MKVHILMCNSMEWKGNDYGWGDFQECGLPATWFCHTLRGYHCDKHKAQFEISYKDWDELELVEVPDDTEVLV